MEPLTPTRAGRLPGLYFEAPPQPVPTILPRMDVAAFVGFASAGPLDLPVAVEDGARFRDLFGPDPELAWDDERGRTRRAHLGSAVESFFAQGGRRCWIVRVADSETIVRPTLPVPGLVTVTGAAPVLARTRSPGSWLEDLRLGTALVRDPIPVVDPKPESPEPTWSVADTSYRFDLAATPGELVPGDLLEVVFGLDLHALVVVDEVEPRAGRWRVSGHRGFWFEQPAASPPGSPPAEDQLLPPQPLGEPQGVARALASLGSPVDPEVQPAVRRLSFELSAWRGTDLVARLPGLAFERRHPRFWAALPADAELFDPNDREEDRYDELVQEVAAPPRFPLAGPESPPKLYLPVGMGRDRVPGPEPDPDAFLESRLERDGLETFGAGLFLDSHLAGRRVGSLLAEAEHRTYVRGLALRGVHGLLPLEEVSLVAVPDAVHRGWSREIGEDLSKTLLEAPHLQELPAPDRAGRYPLTWTSVPGATGYQVERDTDPAFPHPARFETTTTSDAVTLPPGCPGGVWFRVRALRHGEIGPWSNTRGALLPPPDFAACAGFPPGPTHLARIVLSPGGPALGWSSQGVAESWEVEEAVDAAFVSARVVQQDSVTVFELPEIRNGVCYYRVRGLHPGAQPVPHGPWSNTVVVAAVERSGWIEPAPEGYRDTELLAIHRALLRFSAARADLLALLSLPDHYRETETLTHVSRLTPGGGDDGGFTGSGGARVPPLARSEAPVLGFGALFHPWVTVRRTGAILRNLPPDGPLAGLLADVALGRGAWIAPANRAVEGVLALDPDLPEGIWNRLTANRVNLLLRHTRGFLTLGADTLGLEDSTRPIHVRRLLQLLRRLALREGRRFVFDNHSEDLRNRVRHRFEQTLGDLYVRGAFAGATPRAAFRVTTGETVNPPASVERGRFVVELAVVPARELAFLVIRLLAGDGRLRVEEA